MQDAPTAFPSASHNHDDCVASAIETAENLCRERGLRFTTLRQRVLTLVWDSHKPIGAYDILEMLSKEGKRAAPPTVYRALEFLIEAGLVHRLASLNAFIGCPDPERSHAGQFLICNRCRGVAELDDLELEGLIGGKAAQQGFKAHHQVLEIEGVCQRCQAQD
jgi:Fur family zinc uptake transcriptional regulator